MPRGLDVDIRIEQLGYLPKETMMSLSKFLRIILKITLSADFGIASNN